MNTTVISGREAEKILRLPKSSRPGVAVAKIVPVAFKTDHNGFFFERQLVREKAAELAAKAKSEGENEILGFRERAIPDGMMRYAEVCNLLGIDSKSLSAVNFQKKFGVQGFKIFCGSAAYQYGFKAADINRIIPEIKRQISPIPSINPESLLAELRGKGFLFSLDGRRLRYWPTPPADILEKVKTVKAEFIEILREERWNSVVSDISALKQMLGRIMGDLGITMVEPPKKEVAV